ncbi:MAG TPA: hypothetical protein VLX92_24520 [Kofleriaceae bacterium]|nr:hypothetical protein [Kofleriaceae bacterium]
MSDDYLWNRSGPPDPEVARLEQLLGPLAHDAPLRAVPPRRRRALALGIVVIAAAAGVVLWLETRARQAAPVAAACDGSAGFHFVARGGQVACGGRELAAGVLPVGGVLDTGPHEVEMSIADIGIAELGAHTRVVLDRSSDAGHHLSIEHGHMHARVAAPPRLFQVAAATTEVTDLGCEYTIDVDARGAGAVRVAVGLVELATRGGLVIAPAGTRTQILPGQRPGLPVADGASDALAAAVARYDAGDSAALAELYAAATPRDAITLANLAVVDAAARRGAVARLAALAPHGYAADAALADPKILQAWRDAIVDQLAWPER